MFVNCNFLKFGKILIIIQNYVYVDEEDEGVDLLDLLHGGLGGQGVLDQSVLVLLGQLLGGGVAETLGEGTIRHGAVHGVGAGRLDVLDLGGAVAGLLADLFQI